TKGDRSNISLYGGLLFPTSEKIQTTYPLPYFSDWEEFDELQLQPLTQNAATSIRLPGLFPNAIDVTNFPETIPQYITRAEFYVTSTSLTVSGAMVFLVGRT